MILPRVKYFFFTLLTILISISSHGQYTPTTTVDSGSNKDLDFYHLVTPAKPARPYTKIHYTPPSHQLMSWPNYPSTAEGVMRRMEQNKRDNKLSNLIVKDIVTSLLSKKKRVAIIPKY